MSDITQIATTAVINDAMAAVGDRTLPLEDRAAFYALLHQVQLRINRVLRPAKDEIVIGMEQSGQRELGPLSIKATGVDVRWPVNDEGNWQDAGVQEMLAIFQRMAPEYVRHVPDHLEIRTAELGKGVYDNDPVAKQLHNECKRLRYRTEEARNLSLTVREAKAPKGKAA